MPVLDIRHYAAISALRNNATVTAASQALGLTQPAISHQLAEAERRLGRKLFERVGRRLVLTTAGELLAESAAIILNETKYVEKSISGGPDTERTEVIRIATYAYSTYRWLPRFLKELKLDMPNVDFEFHTDTSTAPMHCITVGEANLGIYAGNIVSKSLEVVSLFKDELVAICHNNHRLANRTYLEATDFLNDPFITYSTTTESGHDEDLLWHPAGVRPSKVLRAGLTEAVVELVRAEFGLGILSQWAVSSYIGTDDLKSIRITPKGLPLTWSAVYRRGQPNEKVLDLIAARLHKWCQKEFGSS